MSCDQHGVLPYIGFYILLSYMKVVYQGGCVAHFLCHRKLLRNVPMT